jgi:VIT1/CCC1 family predicted Fe2+/Mn2+ transporter
MGLSDGMMSPLGVILYLLGHQNLIFPAAVCGALSAMFSMGGSEFLSDSDTGLGGSLMMAGATGLGGILPALPFEFTSGALAIAASVVICVLIGFFVACLRSAQNLLVGLAQTYAVLGLIFAAGLAVAWLIPGGAA